MGPEHVCPASSAPPPANNVHALEENSQSCKLGWAGIQVAVCVWMVIYMFEVWASRCTWNGVRDQNDLLNFSFLSLKQQRHLNNQWAEKQILFQHRKKEDNESNRLIVIGRAEVTSVSFSMFSTLVHNLLPITTTQRLHIAQETCPQIYCRLLLQQIAMLPVTHHNSLSVKHAVYPFNHNFYGTLND